MKEQQFSEEEQIQINLFFLKITDFKKCPCGNQPDGFLRGIMNRPLNDGPFSMKPPVELESVVRPPKSYRRKIDET